MNIDTSFAWAGLVLLGAIHGINPGMGWLFAVALGLQEQRRGAVWGALGPLALGHALSIAFAVLLAGAIGLIIPLSVLKWLVAGLLLGFGAYKLVRSRHPRWGGMRVNARELTIWSFLMATAHGAGLMVLPLFIGLSAANGDASAGGVSHAHAHHAPAFIGGVPDAHAAHGPSEDAHHSALLASSTAVIEHPHSTGSRPVADSQPAGSPAGWSIGLASTLAHTLGYLLVTALIAVIVYEKLGLRLLNRMWFNLDRLWAGALILTALLTPLV